jgi:hypothetical protein
MSVRYSSKRYNLDKPVKIEGRVVLEFTPADVGSVSRSAWVINPIQFGTTKVLDDLAHQFVWFRFTKLRTVIFSASATIGQMNAVCVLTYPPVTLPASLEEVVETEFSAACFSGQTVPSELTLGPKELGQVQPKWFRVEPTGDDYLEYQGEIVWVDTNQGVTSKQLVLEYEIEFLGLADDPLTPAPMTRPGAAHEPPRLYGVRRADGPFERKGYRQRAERRELSELSPGHTPGDSKSDAEFQRVPLTPVPSVSASQILRGPPGGGPLNHPPARR